MANRCAVATPAGKLQCEVWDDPGHPQLVLYWNSREIAVVDVDPSEKCPRVFTWSTQRRGGPVKGLKIFPGYGEDVGVIPVETDPVFAYTPPAGSVNLIARDGLHGKTVDEFRQVVIPACYAHRGELWVLVTLQWRCPVCGHPRGEIRQSCSLDGSHTLVCDGWDNPCGHQDVYWKLREEAAGNGRNPGMELPPQSDYLEQPV